MGGGWHFCIDRGGTFTDLVARGPDGVQVVRKLLSVNPEHYRDAALAAIQAVLAEHGADLADVEEIRLGTTVATNALLERTGADVLLVVTRGFGDALEIGSQARPAIFARCIVKPRLLYRRVIEVRERISAQGEVLEALDEAHARAALAAAHAGGWRAVAIACLHGWAYPAHERRLADIARELGYTQISVGSEVSGLIRFLPRADTTVADACLSPVLRVYLDRFLDAVRGARRARLLCMQSNGGLAAAQAFRGRDAVLSGPAGGVIGMVAAARRAGFERAIGFDMGGTSTDVSHHAGALERTHASVLAGVRLTAPMLRVHSIAAGGGSILGFDGMRLRVGPRSAGADPGPACYRRGGPLTVTDCNVLLGRVRPEYFPRLFGPGGDQGLDRAAVQAGFAELCARIERANGRPLAPEAAAEGCLTIANRQMAEAIRRISIQRGHDPAGYVLVAFGGAGGQHACAVADAVGIDAILLHPLAGVLSAWGMGLAALRSVVEASVELPLAQLTDLPARVAALGARARAALQAQGAHRIELRFTAQLKYAGADTSLALPYAGPAALASAFAAAHAQRFGYTDPARPLVLAALSAEAVGHDAGREEAAGAIPAPAARPAPIAQVELWSGGRPCQAQVYQRTALAPGSELHGPALVVEQGATTFVDAGWRARPNAAGDLLLERAIPRPAREAIGSGVDPVLLEVFNHRFMALAEDMGLALQSSAASVNIKERLDFSCAVFDAAGDLIANAPHIPVHLGSMSDSVREILRRYGATLRAGDMYMLNAPHAGGTHLPDITVIAPVMLAGETRPAFFTAARGHHADVGGITPGSMPPDSVRIEDEGVLIEAFPLVQDGRLREAEVRALLSGGPHPAREVARNLADLQAQIAACRRGAAELEKLVAHYGREGVCAYMRHVQDNAAAQIRGVIARLSPGAHAVRMDSGATIRVAVRPDPGAGRVCVDFTGTSAQRADNFNAPLSITRAAVLYVFRTLVDDDIPLNEGCLQPIDLVVPEGSLLNPAPGAAVVAGNVETSQVVVDALYGALGVLAAAQGTMNNFSFGDARHQYYETICGGAGAGPDCDGADAVQTHMTNSRLTDPEVLEAHFPVLVEEFRVRRGSGGAGAHRGGDGAVRRIRFRAPLTAAILSNRRATAPFGLHGGGDGLPGHNRVERADGSVAELGAAATVQMQAGEVFVIETPGGGGYGRGGTQP